MWNLWQEKVEGHKDLGWIASENGTSSPAAYVHLGYGSKLVFGFVSISTRQ